MRNAQVETSRAKMAKLPASFEKSRRDVEIPGGPKEGSPREEAIDRRQMASQLQSAMAAHTKANPSKKPPPFAKRP